MGRPLLTIAYSTLGERWRSIRFPDPDPEIEVIVVAQEASAVFGRPDVRAVACEGRGVARSRNRALSEAAGQYLLFADDDIVFDMAEVRAAVEAMDIDSGVDLLLARSVDEHGRLRKRYSNRRRLSKWNAAKAATYEMIVRVDAVRRAGVCFDERFGAGVDQYLGDEYIFIVDLLRAGSRCENWPRPIAEHPADSSGMRYGTAADASARSAVFDRVFGRWALPVKLGFLLRNPRRLADRTAVRAFLIRSSATDRP